MWCVLVETYLTHGDGYERTRRANRACQVAADLARQGRSIGFGGRRRRRRSHRQTHAVGVRYEFATHSLEPGNAYTMWIVVINDPAKCDETPCAPPQIMSEPDLDGQVSWGLDGQVAAGDGTATFAAEIPAGPLLDGCLAVQGLDDPEHAEIHLVLNDHGPVIDALADEMLSTYRAGCADESPFPEIFPETALADGTPGPNTCRLYQAATFLPPDAMIDTTPDQSAPLPT